MYRTRYLESHVLQLSQWFPVVLVTGPRQSGKTTMLQHLVAVEGADRRYVTLDDFGARRLALEDPVLFFQTYPPPMVIDEIQQAPGLLSQLKAVVDRSGKKGLYWLTGSQHFPLMRGVSESLAGRVGLCRLLGLSAAEEAELVPGKTAFGPDQFRGRAKLEEGGSVAVFKRIARGAFPRFIHDDAPPASVYHSSYLQTYIERDIRAMQNLADLAAFERFLRMAAARVGQVLNLSDIGRDTGVTVPTVKEWLALLQATFQVYLLQPYFPNIGKRQIRSPKLYFLDTGLACHLTGWPDGETAFRGAMAGALFENYVVGEVIRSYWHRGEEAPIWYWRTKEKKEVDVLLELGGRLHPVEVKLTGSPGRRDLAGIRSLSSSIETGPGAIVCMTEESSPLSDDVTAIPVTAIR
jgi:uncharacterized protein